MIESFATYVRDVVTGNYPAPQHDYVMPPAEKENLSRKRTPRQFSQLKEKHMKSARKTFSVLALSAMMAAGGAVGYHYLETGPMARASDTAAVPSLSHSQMAAVEELSAAYRQLGDTLSPSVVNIEVHRSVKMAGNHMDHDFLKRFFPNGELPPELRDMPQNPEGDGELDGAGWQRERRDYA